MSLLTPLFMLGAGAIVAPIVFHLIRRTPRGDVPFSSLMFLSPTPPTLTRRSRLDRWLLLLLRAAALALIALAFARPFLREPMRQGAGEEPRQRIALVVDTSASMRRGDLWKRAQAVAREVIDGCRPTDELALFSFDVSTRPLMGFDESATLDPARRRSLAQGLVAGLSPTWGATNLGQALIDAVTAVDDVADTTAKTGRVPRRVVLVSDLQQGSQVEALGDFEWPSDVALDLKVVSDHGSNAGLHGPAGAAAAPEPGRPAGERRVRVSNDPGSRLDKFQLVWVDGKGVAVDSPIEVYVPPGESRVVRVPAPRRPGPGQSLRLTGDACDFDNAVFFVNEHPREATALYLGSDSADDPAGLLYYLRRALIDTADRPVAIRAHKPSELLAWEPDHDPSLVVIATSSTRPENAARLREFLHSGGTVLYVVTAAGKAGLLAEVAGVAGWDIASSPERVDVMLAEIAFDHPLFAPFAAAQFNDFTKIHFWRYRRIDPLALGDTRVLARFENGDAAVVERLVEKGRLIVMTSGWQPADSQLARSSKFVPLMMALLESRDPRALHATSYIVHDRVPLPAVGREGAGLVVRKPDGKLVPTALAGDQFAETDLPGVFTIDAPGGARSFAVNLDPNESKTSPLYVETLEQLGCRLATHLPKKADEAQLRQMYSVELENRQKLWRVLILAAIGVLIVETWLAGRVTRPGSSRVEALAS